MKDTLTISRASFHELSNLLMVAVVILESDPTPSGAGKALASLNAAADLLKSVSASRELDE